MRLKQHPRRQDADGLDLGRGCRDLNVDTLATGVVTQDDAAREPGASPPSAGTALGKKRWFSFRLRDRICVLALAATGPRVWPLSPCPPSRSLRFTPLPLVERQARPELSPRSCRGKLVLIFLNQVDKQVLSLLYYS